MPLRALAILASLSVSLAAGCASSRPPAAWRGVDLAMDQAQPAFWRDGVRYDNLDDAVSDHEPALRLAQSARNHRIAGIGLMLGGVVTTFILPGLLAEERTDESGVKGRDFGNASLFAALAGLSMVVGSIYPTTMWQARSYESVDTYNAWVRSLQQAPATAPAPPTALQATTPSATTPSDLRPPELPLPPATPAYAPPPPAAEPPPAVGG